MPGSWERSRVGDIDSLLDANPPEPAAPEGFLLSEAWLNRNSPAQAGTGDPDPGARAAEACAQERGACRRERGASRIPMAERTPGSSRMRRAVLSAAQEFICIWFAASCGSTKPGGEDFGYFSPEKAGSNPACDARTVERPGEGYARAMGAGSAARQQLAQAITDADIACSPACCFQLPVREHRARRW
jgi:hypothetical protein